jgi:2-polyprenyl-6-methoxyphenol hydroxylase-like FAD-dependent oxidoreductase
MSKSHADVDVLVVGAGPTGLTLTAQLARFGVRFRITDKQVSRAGESRALAVQARSLEVLQSLGLGEALAARGQSTTRLMLHVDQGDPPSIDLGHVSWPDTRFPYILFVSQAETEGVLERYLEQEGVAIERGVELATFTEGATDIRCVLRHRDGTEEAVGTQYLVGCDGAHSTVRKGAHIPFEGGVYAQTFALGDVEADGPLGPGGIHVFGAGRGFAMFFPLGHPRTWRVMAMEQLDTSSAASTDGEVTTHDLSLVELQQMVDGPTGRSVTLRDPAWLTRFRLHHRQAVRYQQGRVFLAGDAAHIHSPVGAQGMNTGIQDAWNLGWKLAMVVKGLARGPVLDSYHEERWRVGHTLLRVTDRLFAAFAQSISGSDAVIALRRVLIREVVAPALSQPRIRALAFHFISQLGIHYQGSQIVSEGEPRLHRGPKAGDRLPDVRVKRGDGITYLQQELAGPPLQLLLCGPADAGDAQRLADLEKQFRGVVSTARLTRDESGGALVDVNGEAFQRLGVNNDAAQYLVRPDGHVAFRCAGRDLSPTIRYLQQWFCRKD